MAAETIPERSVLEVWQSAVRHRKDLSAAADYPLKIIYPGRPNDGRGADLKDAVIATPRGIQCGDIEIHLNSGAWKEHGHHLDPAYNNVVLHVVRRNDDRKDTFLQNGLAIPTIALDDFIEQQPEKRLTSVFTPASIIPCSRDTKSVIKALEEAGEARFRDKAGDFAEEMLADKPEQGLYRGIITALGYSKNKTPMSRLADAVPLQELVEITDKTGDNEANMALAIQAMLLGSAGLLPSQRPMKTSPERQDAIYEALLGRAWQSSGRRAQLSYRDWEFYKVRPGNYPTRRLAAMAVLLARLRKPNMLELFQKAISRDESPQGVFEEMLMVGAEGFWKEHIDFRTPARGVIPALLGKDRAGEIVINVLLPFYAAFGEATGQPELAGKAFSIYCSYPAGPENSVERHMRKQFGLDLKSTATAVRRQGLMHIYKVFCTQGRCGECALGIRDKELREEG